ncbi:MAG: heavy-metal-associated domain-containing protein [Chitinophagales bacterium]
MRKITSFCCFFLISASFFLLSCTSESGNTSDPNESETSNQEVTANDSALLSIEGMMCPTGCAKPIEAKLASCAGVSACVVDFENQTAFVRFDNSSITPDSMIQVIGALHDGAYTASVQEAL